MKTEIHEIYSDKNKSYFTSKNRFIQKYQRIVIEDRQVTAKNHGLAQQRRVNVI